MYINGTGTERAIPVQRPFDIRSVSVRSPFFLNRRPLNGPFMGSFF